MASKVPGLGVRGRGDRAPRSQREPDSEKAHASASEDAAEAQEATEEVRRREVLAPRTENGEKYACSGNRDIPGEVPGEVDGELVTITAEVATLAELAGLFNI